MTEKEQKQIKVTNNRSNGYLKYVYDVFDNVLLEYMGNDLELFLVCMYEIIKYVSNNIFVI